ncbi:hypothetical protein [Mammaliicoccus lentus]|uniref:hypothetical protein n=1 Tax=Mammaliicoccus lentus TaxID=42858 RepID=UPI003CE89D06
MKKMSKFLRISIKSLIIIILVIAVVLLLNFLVSKVTNLDLKERLGAILAFIGLFATAGGAYWGAKISGDISRELLRKQLVINTFETKYEKNVKLISKFQSLIEEIENECEKMELIDFKFINSKSDNCRLLIKIKFNLLYIVYKFNEYERYCKENNLNGNNVSILILKDIENVKKRIEDFRRIYNNIEKMIEDNASSKWCKEMGLKSYYHNKLKIIYNENEKYKFEDGKFKFNFNYDNNEKQIDLSVDEAFVLENNIRLLSNILKVKKIVKTFRRSCGTLSFKNEQDIINYINFLYTQM